MNDFYKDVIKSFLLTIALLPLPQCAWTHSGKACFAMPPLVGLIDSLLAGGIALYISMSMIVALLTAFTLSKIEKAKRNWLIFLIIWVSSMAVVGIAYLLYGIYFYPTGGIE